MPKKILLICLLLIVANSAYSNTYYEEGTRYLNRYQYSSAIDQFKNSIRQYPNDYNSRIGLINAYSARASYNYKTAKDYQKTLNDLRSALFYIKYYGDGATSSALQSAEVSTQKNINEMVNLLKPNLTPEGLLNTAKQLREQSELPSSFIVYQQLFGTKYDKEASIASGDILKVLKNPELAIIYYNKILRTEPNNYDILVKIGECYQDTGNANLAAESFNKALEISGNKEVAAANLEKIWRQQIYKNPADAEAHANLGVVYQQKGDYEAALQEYQKAQQLNPNNMTTKLNLGTLYQAQEKYENAITLYDKVLFSDANNIEARKYKAQCLEALGKNNEAIVEYKRILALSNNDNDAKNAIINLASKSGSMENYVKVLDENISDPTKKAELLYQSAYDLHKNKKYEEAKKYYIESLTMNGNQPDAYLNLSDIYIQLKDEKAAISLLKQANEKFPSNTQISDRLNQFKLAESQQTLEKAGQALLSGKYDNALSLYKSIQPQTIDSLIGIASTYQSMGNYKEAIANYKKAETLEPNNAETAYYIASAYIAIEDNANAKTYVNKVLKLNPNHQNAKNLQKYISEAETQKGIDKALDMYNEKKYDQAYSLLSSMISANPSVAVPYYYRGMVLDEQKKYELAITDYKNTIKYDPNFDLAYYSLGVDYDTIKNYKEAYNYYMKFLKITSEENEYTDFVKKRVEELRKYVPNIAQTK